MGRLIGVDDTASLSGLSYVAGYAPRSTPSSSFPMLMHLHLLASKRRYTKQRQSVIEMDGETQVGLQTAYNDMPGTRYYR